MTLYLPILILLLLILIGIPVAWSMAVSGILGIYLVTGRLSIVLGTLETIPYGQGTSYVLLTIPMFMLLAYLLGNARISDDMYDSIALWTGGLRGGLATSTVYASAIFGAMSGSSVASATVMSTMAVPSMRRHGYHDALAAGAVGIGSTLSILIPPSILMIVYGISTETSIGRLLVAGVVPGIMLTAVVALTISIWVRLRPSIAPRTEPSSFSDRVRGGIKIAPAIILILIMMTFLYSGLATPTEVAAIGALGALLIGVTMGRLNLQLILDAFRKSLQTSIMIFVLLIGATFFAQYLAYARIPATIVSAADQFGMSGITLIASIAFVYIIGCMIMDELPFMLLTLPISFPLVTAAGYDPIWFGVFSMLLIAIGLISPPVGVVSFVVGAASDISLPVVFRGVTVMIIPVIIVLITIVVWPDLVLWLPSQM